MRDTVVAGVVAGTTATIGAQIIEWVLVLSGFAQPEFLPYLALLIFPEGAAPLGPAQVISLLFAAFTGSAIFGTGLAFLYTRTGGGFWIVKGVAYAGFLFVVHVSLIPKMWEPRLLAVLAQPGVMTMEVIKQVVWATLTAYLLAQILEEGEVRAPVH